jgi:hypothetical protein
MSDPAARLRAAAELLRERAAAATPGPWRWGRDLDPSKAVAISPDHWTVFREARADDARWTQLMSPAVAEMLASMLEAEADCQDSIADVKEIMPRLVDSIAGEPIESTMSVSIDTSGPALAFADYLLTDTEGTPND